MSKKLLDFIGNFLSTKISFKSQIRKLPQLAKDITKTNVESNSQKLPSLRSFNDQVNRTDLPRSPP